jgi:hypothetical protein
MLRGASPPSSTRTRSTSAFFREDGKEVFRREIQLHAGKILIATGSSPVRPAMFPFDDGEIYDSDTILNLDRIPKVMAVIGAGVIGAEYGCTFCALGARSTSSTGATRCCRFSTPRFPGPGGYADERRHHVSLEGKGRQNARPCWNPAGKLLELSSGRK